MIKTSMINTSCVSINMELRHLRYFIGVVDAGSMALASRRLHVSQPTLSRQIHDLEQEFGVRLFDRVGRNLKLTVEGRELVARSRHVMAEAEALKTRGSVLGGSTAGVLRVGAPPQFIEAGMPGVLRAYQRAHPAVEVQLSEDGGQRLISRVEQGQLHLAVGMLRDAGQLASRLLYPLRVLAVMSHGHRLSSRGGGSRHCDRSVRRAARSRSRHDRRPRPPRASTRQLGARDLAPSTVSAAIRKGIRRHARAVHKAVVSGTRPRRHTRNRPANILSAGPFQPPAGKLHVATEGSGGFAIMGPIWARPQANPVPLHFGTSDPSPCERGLLSLSGSLPRPRQRTTWGVATRCRPRRPAW